MKNADRNKRPPPRQERYGQMNVVQKLKNVKKGERKTFIHTCLYPKGMMGCKTRTEWRKS